MENLKYKCFTRVLFMVCIMHLPPCYKQLFLGHLNNVEILKTQTIQSSKKVSKFHVNTQCKKNP